MQEIEAHLTGHRSQGLDATIERVDWFETLLVDKKSDDYCCPACGEDLQSNLDHVILQHMENSPECLGLVNSGILDVTSFFIYDENGECHLIQS